LKDNSHIYSLQKKRLLGKITACVATIQFLEVMMPKQKESDLCPMIKALFLNYVNFYYKVKKNEVKLSKVE